MRRVWVVCAALLCAAAYGGAPAWALSVTGLLAPTPAVVARVPSPEHPGHACYATASNIEVLPLGPNPDLEAAWAVPLPGDSWNPALWTLNWSTSTLDATLNISTYRAVNYAPGDPKYNPTYYAGAEIRIDWTPTPEQRSLKWIQAIYTNSPRYPWQRTMDVLPLRPPWDMAPAYPYSYPDYHFEDMPRRACDAGQSIFWNGYLYLADIDRTSKSVTIYEGIHWGFTVESVPVPEPSCAVAVLAGISWAAIRRYRPITRA